MDVGIPLFVVSIVVTSGMRQTRVSIIAFARQSGTLQPFSAARRTQAVLHVGAYGEKS